MPRREHSFHYIYKTTNLVNNRFYVGMHSTSNLEDGYIGSGKLLWRSIHYYGRENFRFEILEMHPDRDSIRKREEEIVNEDLLKDPLCMNLQRGGFGWRYRETHPNFGKVHPNWKFSEEAHEKQRWLWKNDPVWAAKFSENRSNSKLGKKRPDIKTSNFNFKGQKHSRETVEQIKRTLSNRVLPEDHGRKISETKKKQASEGILVNSQTGTCWIHNDVCNKKIKLVELPEYQSLGWLRGSKRAFFNEDKSKFRTQWIHNDSTSIRVHKDELEKYLNDGWHRGQGSRRKTNDDA